ncbi:uncharacterized protein LAESUDRAFT_791123 [Laetiporus sulphureus 93-53]|uniref:DUF4387 domain-containing protein n=1 Tax=Laetiporus sulphureus 93-53 TaxID=1314785 RepID=A0A165CK40_9APHY|nr:uncharacterized protein LAESUDRAFT_791123 [Laetiporus sulphureus 93-53]KZT02956.1 hypothetical protein LAESUDRAFT_791123 [Laetiporus sulphureus 93-53]
MEGKKVDPVAQWRRAIEHGDKTIKLRDVATVLRSKNSGPYELTFDVMFPNDEIFQAVKNSGVLTKEILAKVYGVKLETVLACLFFPQARAFKFTIPRCGGYPWSMSSMLIRFLCRVHPNGSFGETDMHGCQQHIPLVDTDVLLPIAAQ